MAENEWISLGLFHPTFPETNIATENRPSQKKLVFQPSIFRGYVSFREGILYRRYRMKSSHLLADRFVEGAQLVGGTVIFETCDLKCWELIFENHLG